MTIVHTTYGRNDIVKQKLELTVVPVGNMFGVFARFGNNGLHRTIKLYESDTAQVLVKALTKYVKSHEFPWMDDLGVRQWSKIEQHGMFNFRR